MRAEWRDELYILMLIEYRIIAIAPSQVIATAVKNDIGNGGYALGV